MAILVGIMLLGSVLSVFDGDMSVFYRSLFTTAVIFSVMWVHISGLFLVVAAVPVVFGVLTPLTAWCIMTFGTGSFGGLDMTITEVLTVVYPLAELFPSLISVFLGGVTLALIRVAVQ